MSFRKFLVVVAFSFLLLPACRGESVPGPQEAKNVDTNPANNLVNDIDLINQEEEEATADTDEQVEPDTITLALSPYASYAPLYFGIAEGFFAEQNLEVEVVELNRMSEILPALATGQIDVAAGIIDVGSLAAIAEGTGIKIVADKGYLDPTASCSYSGWFATDELLNSGELDQIENIAGKKVSLTRASYFEYAMDKLLEPSGMSVDDLEIIEMPIPSRFEAILNGAIDLGVFAEPWILRGRAENAGDIWISYEESIPYGQYGVIYYGSTLVEDNPDAGNRFMVGYLKAVQMYNQGKTERNVELMAEFTKANLDEARDTCWQTFKPDSSINTESLLDFQAWAFNKGYLDQELAVDDFFDGSFLDYAQNHTP